MFVLPVYTIYDHPYPIFHTYRLYYEHQFNDVMLYTASLFCHVYKLQTTTINIAFEFENFTRIAFSGREMMYLSYSFLICLGKQMLRTTNLLASLARYMTVYFKNIINSINQMIQKYLEILMPQFTSREIFEKINKFY